METTKIQDLLNKYFEGTTSVEEEATLKAYFSNTAQVETRFQQYAPLFQYFVAAKSVTYQGKTLPSLSKKRYFKHPYYLLVAVAASLAILFVISTLWQDNSKQPETAQIDWSKYEITDEEEAAKQTVAALRLLAAKLNSGTKQVAKEIDKIGSDNPE